MSRTFSTSWQGTPGSRRFRAIFYTGNLMKEAINSLFVSLRDDTEKWFKMTIMCFVYYNYFILCCFVFGITQKKSIYCSNIWSVLMWNLFYLNLYSMKKVVLCCYILHPFRNQKKSRWAIPFACKFGNMRVTLGVKLY